MGGDALSELVAASRRAVWLPTPGGAYACVAPSARALAEQCGRGGGGGPGGGVGGPGDVARRLARLAASPDAGDRLAACAACDALADAPLGEAASRLGRLCGVLHAALGHPQPPPPRLAEAAARAAGRLAAAGGALVADAVEREARRVRSPTCSFSHTLATLPAFPPSRI